MHCAAVPNGRCHWPFQIHTRSPTRDAATPTPTASITPAPSLCGTICGNAGVLLRRPRRDFTSLGFTPDHCSFTRTSPAPGSGVGRSTHFNTSAAGPVSV
jgi:hypothetical protein